MKSKNQGNDVDATNPIRERLKDRHSVDFSSATRRRLALFYQKRDEWFYYRRFKAFKKIKIEPHIK